MPNSYYLEMTKIKKKFDTIQVIVDGNFNLNRGEIHSLIGENDEVNLQ